MVTLEPYYRDQSLLLYHSDVIETLRKMPADSVHMCVTSPPYYALRDYGTATWEGGDVTCTHKPKIIPRKERSMSAVAMTVGLSHVDAATEGNVAYKSVCKDCGAKRVDQQIGLEETPEAFIAKMVEVFREVRRVLRSDGTCWINIGDSYAGGGQGPTGKNGIGKQEERQGYHTPGRAVPVNLKPKDLIGIPWMLAFALRADGWWLRQDIIWHKPNPMPESVTDRCTKAHEYLFLLSKSKDYYYDIDAIKESLDGGAGIRTAVNGIGNGELGKSVRFGSPDIDGRRNKRSVWTIATEPYAEAHFATFPTALVRPCIKAGTSEYGCCRVCRAPWERQVEVGWAPTCACGADVDVVPCTVLDPFIGSGTTGYVAKALGRRAVGIDLSAEYLDLAVRRCSNMVDSLDIEEYAKTDATKKRRTRGVPTSFASLVASGYADGDE